MPAAERQQVLAAAQDVRDEALLCRMGVRDRHLPAVVAVG
jgi:hypothetical protein